MISHILVTITMHFDPYTLDYCTSITLAVRLSAYELIQVLCEEPELSVGCHSAVMRSVERHLQESPHHSSEHWWKVR